MKKIFVLMVIVSVLALTLPASASDMGLKRINGQVGILFPSGLDNADYGVSFLLGAGVDVGEITDDLRLVPSLSYWIISVEPEGGAPEGFDISASNFQIAVDLQYYLKDVKGLYFGGGLSLNFKSVSWDVPAQYQQFYPSGSDSETDVGFGLLGGYELPFNKTTTGFAHLKYNIISDLNTFAIVFGVWFDMKK